MKGEEFTKVSLQLKKVCWICIVSREGFRIKYPSFVEFHGLIFFPFYSEFLGYSVLLLLKFLFFIFTLHCIRHFFLFTPRFLGIFWFYFLRFLDFFTH